jgi:hypothetical protein
VLTKLSRYNWVGRLLATVFGCWFFGGEPKPMSVRNSEDFSILVPILLTFIEGSFCRFFCGEPRYSTSYDKRF